MSGELGMHDVFPCITGVRAQLPAALPLHLTAFMCAASAYRIAMCMSAGNGNAVRSRGAFRATQSV
jgi:hypothetical protein